MLREPPVSGHSMGQKVRPVQTSHRWEGKMRHCRMAKDIGFLSVVRTVLIKLFLCTGQVTLGLC